MASGSRTLKRSPSPAEPPKELPKELPYDFVKTMTNDFAKDRVISESPFGKLYKGIVPDDGREMAVKKLQENASMPTNKTFSMEVQNVMVLQHENIVQIRGYCSETSKKLVQFDKRYIQADVHESLIVYEYLPKGSLKDALFGENAMQFASPKEDWDTRFKIINGICQGLHFLHTLDVQIIHMDLKPENILLDKDLVPKIADFALSRLFGQEQTRLCTQTVVGSYGYMAPEYLYRGEVSAQSDIYSLGLMIIEIATREQNTRDVKEPSARKFIEKVQKEWTTEHIASKYNSLSSQCLHQVKVCIEIGMVCVSIDRKLRPKMEEIVSQLRGIH